MSDPNSNAAGASSNSSYQYRYEDLDHETDPTFLSFDSNVGGNFLPSTQRNQSMAPPPFGGHSNNTNSSFSTGRQPSQTPPDFTTDRSDPFRPQQPNFFQATQSPNNYAHQVGYGQPTYSIGNRGYTYPQNMNRLPSPSQSAQDFPGLFNNFGYGSGLGGNLYQSPHYSHQGQMIQQPPNPMTQPAFVRQTGGRSDLPPSHPHYVSPDGDDDEDEEDESANGGDNESDDEGSSTPVEYQGLIQSEKDFERLSVKRLQEGQKIAKGFKDTSPDDADEKQACIRELFNAIMHTTDVVDKPAHDGRKAQAARRIDMGYYTPQVVEMACWEIFKKCKVSSTGHRLVAPFHKCKQEGSDYHGNFMERWDAIVAACKNSKAVCKQVLDPSYMDRLVDAPEAQYKMKLNNKKINAERDFQNKLGRQAINAGIQIADLPNADEKNMVITPSKNKSGRQGGSSNKRLKSRLVKREDSDEDDEGDADGTPAYETPVKASLYTMSSRTIRNPNKRTPSKATPPSKAKAVKPSPFPVPTEELNLEYRLEICNLLVLQHSNADKFSLDQLRTFARGYNGDRSDDNWYHESFTKGQYCREYVLFTAEGHGHFCNYHPFSNLRALAYERGELAEDSSMISGHYADYYPVGNNLHLKQVLGIAPNAFGMINFSQPPQED